MGVGVSLSIYTIVKITVFNNVSRKDTGPGIFHWCDVHLVKYTNTAII